MTQEAFITVKGLTKRYGANFAAQNIDFSLEQGAFLSLLGPSGSGKTTVLRMLAGLAEPDSGHISIGGKEIFGPKRNTPVEERGLGMVFQDYALWPHMTVAQNISFGLRLRRMASHDIRARVHEMLDLTALTGLEHRFPFQLSGGQQQRVALARALSIHPPLLLLDEPLSSLDTGLRETMRHELLEIVQKARMTVINVTHDQNEAMVMSDRILLLKNGKIQQFGPPAELYHKPDSAFIGAFMGAANIISGITQNPQSGETIVEQNGLRIHCLAPRDEIIATGQCAVLCRPESIITSAAEPENKENVFSGTVHRASFSEGRWRLSIQTPLREPLLADSAEQILPGTFVWVTLPKDRCLLVKAETEPALASH